MDKLQQLNEQRRFEAEDKKASKWQERHQKKMAFSDSYRKEYLKKELEKEEAEGREAKIHLAEDLKKTSETWGVKMVKRYWHFTQNKYLYLSEHGNLWGIFQNRTTGAPEKVKLNDNWLNSKNIEER